jgi:hypothetical protein
LLIRPQLRCRDNILHLVSHRFLLVGLDYNLFFDREVLCSSFGIGTVSQCVSGLAHEYEDEKPFTNNSSFASRLPKGICGLF